MYDDIAKIVLKDKRDQYGYQQIHAVSLRIPQVIFTDPQIASVGFTEIGARRLNINVRSVDYEIDTLQGANLHTDGLCLSATCHDVVWASIKHYF